MAAVWTMSNGFVMTLKPGQVLLTDSLSGKGPTALIGSRPPFTVNVIGLVEWAVLYQNLLLTDSVTPLWRMSLFSFFFCMCTCTYPVCVYTVLYVWAEPVVCLFCFLGATFYSLISKLFWGRLQHATEVSWSLVEMGTEVLLSFWCLSAIVFV